MTGKGRRRLLAGSSELSNPLPVLIGTRSFFLNGDLVNRDLPRALATLAWVIPSKFELERETEPSKAGCWSVVPDFCLPPAKCFVRYAGISWRVMESLDAKTLGETA